MLYQRPETGCPERNGNAWLSRHSRELSKFIVASKKAVIDVRKQSHRAQ